MMSENLFLPIILDGPMQSWGVDSRFDRRQSELFPTRSGIFGLIAAAMGIDKHSQTETDELIPFQSVRLSVFLMPRKDHFQNPIPIRRLEDYHTVTGFRRASGKVAIDATALTYRQYLMEARFGALLNGPEQTIQKIQIALSDPTWGVWLGRKCCIPTSPVLAGECGNEQFAWKTLLAKTGYDSETPMEFFDRMLEVTPDIQGGERRDDEPICFGAPIGERHGSRWVERLARKTDSQPN